MWEKGAVLKDASFNVYAKDSTKNKIVTVSVKNNSILAGWFSKVDSSLPLDSKNGEIFEVIPVNEDVSSKKDMESSLFVKEEEDAYIVDAGCVHAVVPKNKNVILRDVTVDGCVQVTDADLVLQLEERNVKDGVLIQKTVPYTGEIESVSIEEQGPVRVTFCFKRNSCKSCKMIAVCCHLSFERLFILTAQRLILSIHFCLMVMRKRIS